MENLPGNRKGMKDMGRRIRDPNHEIDTAARRIVPSLLPRAWEHREPGGRDYGIDMQIELFADGEATGKTLLMQIKGTGNEIPTDLPAFPFDLKTQTLTYSELFAVPFLLAVCPVNSNPPRFFYVWLQEYIGVLLDEEKPGW